MERFGGGRLHQHRQRSRHLDWERTDYHEHFPALGPFLLNVSTVFIAQERSVNCDWLGDPGAAAPGMDHASLPSLAFLTSYHTATTATQILFT